MQRRAAAVYVVLFVLLAGGSYAFIATAQSPTVTIEDADHDLQEGDQFDVGDRTYTVTEITREEEEDHGEIEIIKEAKVEWTDDSATMTESFDRGGEIELDNTTYEVVIPNESDPGSATLREQPGDDVETVERDGQRFVVVEREGENDELVPIDEYEALDRIELSDGDRFEYDGNDTEVTVYRENVTLTWTGSVTTEVEVLHEQNATLNGQQFLVFVSENGERLQLTTDYESYQEQVDTVDRFEQRMNGFWGVTIVAGLAAILMSGLAYLPHKDT